jgi:hypothetical protein
MDVGSFGGDCRCISDRFGLICGRFGIIFIMFYLFGRSRFNGKKYHKCPERFSQDTIS